MSLRLCVTLLAAFPLACSSTTRDLSTPDASGLDATTGGHGGSMSDASSDARGDAEPDGASGGRSGSDGSAGTDDGGGGDAESDGGEPAHLCYVDGCNGELDSISSAVGCPARRPELEASCTLANGAECFYCEPGQQRLASDATIPAYVCTDGTWTYEELISACD